MRVKIPFNVTVQGEEDAVILNSVWNTVKNVCATLFAVLLLIGLPMLGARVGGTMAVVWLVCTAIAIAIVMFGAKAVAEQPSGMGKFGVVMLIILIIGMIAVGAVIFQKMMATETPAAAVSTPMLVIPAPTPVVPEVTIPQPQPAPASVIVSSETETEHRAGSGGSVSVGREATESPPVTQQEAHEISSPSPVSVEDECDPGGEKASAWGRR